MATTTITLSIPLNGTGTEIPSLLTTDPYDLYLITGTAVAIGNYAIVPTGTPGLGLTYNFRFIGSLDITTNTKTFSLFGVAITQEQLNKNWEARCFYNGTAWEVILEMDFTEAQIVSSVNIANNAISSSNLANGSVTTPKLDNLAVTSAKLATDAVTTAKIIDDAVTTSKIIDDAVTTAKILDSNITTAKINDLAVTTAKVNDLAITTAKLADTSITNAKVAANAIDTTNIVNNAVTNAKLAVMADNTIKANTSGGSSSPSDINISTLFNNNGWSLSGNSGTTPGTDFIGTTDSKDLVFKFNNFESGRINGSSGNTSFGYLTLYVITTGFSNTAFGYQSLSDNTTGSRNTAVGTGSLSNLSSGTDNVAIGLSSGTTIGTGSSNTFIGSSSGGNSATSMSRIAIGAGAEATLDYQFAIPDNVTSIKFKGIVYTLPTVNAAGVLTNDGSGNLTWS